MPGKKLLWVVLAAGFLSSNGCCGMWDRWCNPQPRCYQPAPPTCGCPQAPPACAPQAAYSPPPITPVPSTPPPWAPPTTK